MFLKKKIFFLFIFLVYQTASYSKSNSLGILDSNNFSKYFSGIVAFENNNNNDALNFFNSSKILINRHEPFLKRYTYSLILGNKISQAINIIKKNLEKKNTEFFDAYLLLTVDSLKKNDLEQAKFYLDKTDNLSKFDRFNEAIVDILKQYIFVFDKKKIPTNENSFGKLSLISETFQRCFLNDVNTSKYFLNLFNDQSADYSRYIYFYLGYLIENNDFYEAKKVVEKMEYINTTLLLSQGKSWIEKGRENEFKKVFSCKNSNDIIGEFFFLISNLYSSQDNFSKSNFYLNLSNFLNPKFKFNFSLVAENQYFNGEFNKAKKTLKNFKKEDDFYYWYRIKKEAQIISKQKNKYDSLDYIKTEFAKISNPNPKFLFDIANFYKNSKKYDEAIKYYTKIIDTIDENSEIKSDILYRRGGSYERIGNYEKSDEDLLNALEIKPNDAYILNYLAYSWLERDYKIEKAIEMLETAYSLKENDPYIIDSIGWAYYLINDFLKAEKFLKRAVELMPDDPIVNDHYGDILWKLERKIQARYFWSNVLKMEDAEEELLENIKVKIVEGLKVS